jgi:hypothetical protein
MKKSAVLSMALAALAMLALGCGSKTTTVAPGGSVTVNKSVTGQVKDVKVQTKEGTYTSKVGSGKTITAAELGAPVYPGATEVMAGGFKGNQMASQPGYSQHILSTSDGFDKVNAFYKSNLKNPVSQEMSQGGKKIAVFVMNNGATMVHLMTDPDKKKTMIMVMKKQ